MRSVLNHPWAVGLVFLENVSREPVAQKIHQLDVQRDFAALEPVDEFFTCLVKSRCLAWCCEKAGYLVVIIMASSALKWSRV